MYCLSEMTTRRDIDDPNDHVLAKRKSGLDEENPLEALPAYSELEHDYPFLYPSVAHQKPLVIETNELDDAEPQGWMDADQLQPLPASIQRPVTLRRYDDGEEEKEKEKRRFTFDDVKELKPHYSPAPKVTFANGEKVKIPIVSSI